MLRVANYARRTGNLDVDVRRPSSPRAPDATRPDPEVASPEVMKVPHYLMIDSHGAELEDRNTATIPKSEANLELEPVLVLEPMEVHVIEEPPAPPPRRTRIYHLHPEHRLAHLDPDTDSGNQIIRSLAESYGETAPRSDVTEGVYLAGPTTPPALQPKRLLSEFTADRLPEEATPTAASPLASLYSPRDLQQTEVRDRQSGKPSPKASSLIEMYCEKERQPSNRNAPGESPIAPGLRLTSAQASPTHFPLVGTLIFRTALSFHHKILCRQCNNACITRLPLLTRRIKQRMAWLLRRWTW
jgi:hypothetical protein